MINFPLVIEKFDKILTRGLCVGVGKRDGQMCIEAAICAAMDLPHGDNPSCVAEAVRSYKITLNDANWSSPAARASGLRNLGIAQIGSKGVVDNREFATLLAAETIGVLIPKLFRLPKYQHNTAIQKAADRCEKERSKAAAYAAAYAAANAAAYAATRAANAAAYAATRAAVAAACAADAAYAATRAADATNVFLILSADLALGVLRKLKSPGCEWLDL